MEKGLRAIALETEASRMEGQGATQMLSHTGVGGSFEFCDKV